MKRIYLACSEFFSLRERPSARRFRHPALARRMAPGSVPWSAGTDFSGSWRPKQLVTESQTAAGDLADFGGIPLNDAARVYALSWPASRQTVKQHQCMGYVTPYFWYAPANYRIWEERDPFTQRLVAWRFYGQIAQGDRTVYMDGRPHPPAYAPHTFAGFLDRRISGQHADGHDDAPQARLDQSERRSAERCGDSGGALRSPRRHDHDAGRHRRSGVSQRTVEQGVDARPDGQGSGRMALSVRRQRTDLWPEERRGAQPSVRTEPLRPRIRRPPKNSVAGRAGRRRNDVSGTGERPP